MVPASEPYVEATTDTRAFPVTRKIEFPATTTLKIELTVRNITLDPPLVRPSSSGRMLSFELLLDSNFHS